MTSLLLHDQPKTFSVDLVSRHLYSLILASKPRDHDLHRGMWEKIRMDLKDLFDRIVKRMERAKAKAIRPEITPSPGECTITIPVKESPYSITLKQYPNGVTINTRLGDEPRHQLLMPGATLQDALRVMQAAIIIVYGKSLH
jgi:hypothetical protein